MLESNRSKSKQSDVVVSTKLPSLGQLLKEPDIQFFYRFVSRYGIREKALEILTNKIRQKNSN